MGLSKLHADLSAGLPLGSLALRELSERWQGPVAVVVKPEDDRKWIPQIRKGQVVVVECADAAGGIGHSVRAGMKGLLDLQEAQGLEAVLVMLADQPFIQRDTLQRYLDELDADPARDYVAGCYQGRLMPPVLWSRRCFPELMKLRGDEGARKLMHSGRWNGSRVELDEAEAFDVDTPEQLEEARAWWAAGRGWGCRNNGR
ncbi:nucleotidyltransferase family protein [Paenibacillus tarimensis]|uniref:nucleotidyltransferase family protein n=1 Tax=Paenibacillus tarimensis TaxID=416012 RepID=UPI001F2403CA|nr:nucleotidyltransferase family protein [Paenibacillus tarimensis]MCF2944733.1 nucleotidyltransferase family protein [Paenibacillus tarimensis]